MSAPVMPDYARVAAVAVARGMRLLDERQPGWLERVDLAVLDIGSCAKCVVGQVFGCGESGPSFVAALAQLGLFRGDDESRYGFDAGRGTIWSALTDEWRKAITARRAELVPA